MEQTTVMIPPGYWQDAQGHLVPETRIKDIDKLRHQLVADLCRRAKFESLRLAQFKRAAMEEVAAFVSMSLDHYQVATGGTKGNVTLISFDGKHKIERQVADTMAFGEQLLAAKTLIDECVVTWSEGSSENIKALVMHAFQTDKAGKINTARVLGLRRLDIKDEKWSRAMQAISDSMHAASSKPYIRFYELDERTQEFRPISLNVASI